MLRLAVLLSLLFPTMFFWQCFSLHFLNSENVLSAWLFKEKEELIVLFWCQNCKYHFVFSLPERKSERLVSKGDTPASVIMHQQSSSLKLLGRFTSNLLCIILVTITICSNHYNWPLLGGNRAKYRTTLTHLLLLN
jgi:hypothetical protein